MLTAMIARYGIIAVGLGAGLEGEAVVVTGGVLAGKGLLPLVPTMIAATIGSCVVDQVWFWLGRYSRERPWIKRIRAKAAFAKATSLVERYPVAFILSFRFIYGMRTASPVALGVSNVSARLFVLLNILAAALWAPLFTWLGYWAGPSAEALLRRMTGIGILVLGASLVIGLVTAAIIWRRRKSSQQRAATEF